MYSTWYLFPGQTEETTKIKDRGKALVCTPEGWNKLKDYLERDKKMAEVQEKEKARKLYLKEGSYNMTKNWDNSIEKIQQRRLEQTLQKIEAKKQEKVDRYMFLRKEQQLERQQYVEKAKKKMYMFQEKPRELNSAYLLSEVLHEREVQKKFNVQIKEHDELEEMQMAKHIKEAAEDERRENAEKERLRRETNKLHKKELKTLMDNKIAMEEQERQQSLEDGKVDNLRAEEEMKAIKEYYMQKEKDKKADVKKQFHEFEKLQNELKQQQRNEEIIEDKIISIYAKAKCRIENTRKSKEKEMQEEQIRIKDAIANKVQMQKDTGDAKEKEILENALREYNEREIKKMEAKQEKQNKLREERIKNHIDHVKEEEEKERRNKELETWELVNRLKVKEVVDEYEIEKKQKNINKILNYKKDLLDQMAEKEEEIKYELHCKEEELKYYKKKEEHDNNNFFNYANEVLSILDQKGRNKEPVQKVIEKYKMDNGLKIKRKNMSFINSNVPIDK